MFVPAVREYFDGLADEYQRRRDVKEIPHCLLSEITLPKKIKT